MRLFCRMSLTAAFFIELRCNSIEIFNNSVRLPSMKTWFFAVSRLGHTHRLGHSKNVVVPMYNIIGSNFCHSSDHSRRSIFLFTHIVLESILHIFLCSNRRKCEVNIFMDLMLAFHFSNNIKKLETNSHNIELLMSSWDITTKCSVGYNVAPINYLKKKITDGISSQWQKSVFMIVWERYNYWKKLIITVDGRTLYCKWEKLYVVWVEFYYSELFSAFVSFASSLF